MGSFFACWWRVLWACGAVLGMLGAETIHFTNSPKLLMTSKNYTTYELEVPGSKPITIIEASEPLEGPNQRLDTFPSDPQQQQQQQQQQPLRVGPAGTTSFRTSTGISVSRPAQDDKQPPRASSSSRKTLYSPELLNKFLTEYSEKLRNADSLTRKRLNEITMINSQQHQPLAGEEQSKEEFQYEYRRKPAERPQNASHGGEPSAPEDGAKAEDEFVFEDTHERHGMLAAGSGNRRRYQEPPGAGHGSNNYPWNMKDGWVTLEAVPWSESKVSKWHAATVADANRHGGPGKGKRPPSPQQSLGNYWSDESSEDAPKYKPAPPQPSSIGASSYYPEAAGGGDDYGPPFGATNRLSRPPAAGDSLYNRRRPPYGERPDGDRGGRPSAPDGWYEHQLQANPYDAMKAAEAAASAGHRDIITDGRPANFPAYAVTSPPAAPNLRGRPVSYPDHGNGEWVLISTTKGYQYPKRRHGQRAITFTPATSTSHQTVKLTVLPMKNAVDMTTSHNGLIEVSSSTQTVEDAVKQQQQTKTKNKNKNKRQPPTTTTSPKRKRQPATYSLMRRDAAQDSSAVLAAVGAGMVPATMAILAPMVLGKK